MRHDESATTYVRPYSPERLILSHLALIFTLIISACAKMPSSVGKSDDVVVIAATVNQDLIESTIQLYTYGPQKEPLFTFLFAEATALKQYNRFHTIFLYGSLHDKFIDILLNPDAKKATTKDTFTLFKLNDIWAQGQVVIILATRTAADIERGIAKYRNVISRMLESNYYTRIKDMYDSQKREPDVQLALRRFGIFLDIGKEWMIDSTYKAEQFIVVHAHVPDRSIFFYKEKKPKNLTDAWALQKRNLLTKKYYNGDYALQGLTRYETIERTGMKGIQVTGAWQNDSLIAGGPFISYFLTKDDSLYVLDATLFNPGERKSDYFTVLQVILTSFELLPTGTSP